YTLSSDFPVTQDAMQHTYAGNADTYVSVVNPANTFQSFVVYSTFLGGSHTEVGYGVAGDSAGNIYVTGYTLSPDFPTANAIQGKWANGIDLFLTKFRPGVAGLAALQYSTYIGLTGIYVSSGLAVGPDGTAYVVGYGSLGLPSTSNALQGGGFGGGTDGFLMVVGQ
ncbi:MAG TPA: SBBP repeat-containing protein, partial [Bryobacteraceae bacterium]|nr:SBBP repeat-containing protein [Bryobacteraceae bacterium]